ncbi:MAG TPA: DUF5018 domain-containing protein [Rectinemataceae bacterium]|nr:DUF5018 domain-containing protein [Rectinemataceae bacterium]
MAKPYSRSKLIKPVIASLSTILVLSACTNPLALAVKAVQTATTAPIFVMQSMSGSTLSPGAVLTFSNTSVGSHASLALTIANAGKTGLAIVASEIAITMNSGTEADTFSMPLRPPTTIDGGNSATMTLDFHPISTGNKSATVIIPTNDASNQKFTFTIAGSGLSTGKDFTTFNIANPVAIGSISADAVSVSVPTTTNRGNLVAVFTTSAGATASVSGVTQTSNVTAQDFSNPVIYTITAADGSTKTYTVAVALQNTVPVMAATSTPTNITTASATGSGNILSDGGSAVTVSGLCWSTTQNPTDASSKTTNSASFGEFSSSISPLSPGTTYYVRSFATNSLGTGYGQQVQFATLPAAPAAPTVAAVGGPAGSGQLAVSWSTVAGAVLYEVYCDTTPTIPASTADGGTDIAGTSCTLTNLSNFSNYYVWVKAKSLSGLGGASTASTPTMVGVKVASITLSKSSATFLPGSSEAITAIFSPATATQPFASWGSSATSSATVAGGVVTGGSAAGQATITATAIDGGGATATFTATNKLFSPNTIGPAGGYLFYDKGFYSNGWRYLEAASANVGAGHQWLNASTGVRLNIPGAQGTDFGNGLANTTAIIAAQGAGTYMALDCKNYSQNGYSDWFMPSEIEANQMLYVVSSINYAISLAYLESSTQYNNGIGDGCWAYLCSSPYGWTPITTSVSGSTILTRPIRQF